LIIIQRFGKHYSCHLQGECLEFGHFWKPYIGQAGGKLDMTALIGGGKKRAAIQWEQITWMSNPFFRSTNQHHFFNFTPIYCLPYTSLPKTPNL
jgi:hypothetical protein